MSPAALYLIGVIALSLIGVGGLVLMEWLRPDGYNTAIIGQIIQLIGPSIIGLMLLIRSLHNGQAIKEGNDKVDRVVETARTEAHKEAAQTTRDVLADSVKQESLILDQRGKP